MLKHRKGICFRFYFQESKRTRGEELPRFHPMEGSQERVFPKSAQFQAMGRESTGEQGVTDLGTLGTSNSQFVIPQHHPCGSMQGKGAGTAGVGFAQLTN